MSTQQTTTSTIPSNQPKTEISGGLTSLQAAALLKKYGLNKINKEENKPWWLILIGQLKSPLVYLLLFACGMSFYFNEWLDGVAILVVILFNTGIGFYMEFQANRSMKTLQNLAITSTKVIRDGSLTEINSEEIVPGDVAYVEAGDLIPADGRIIRLSRLQVNESTLTGESVPVEKRLDTTPASSSLGDQIQLLYKGTFVTNGNSHFGVTSTGMSTELGKIANMVHSAEQAATPLEKKLESFSKTLIKITVALVTIIFLVGWISGHDLVEMINTSIALAVAAIPEGLPIVATLGLARGMLRMASHNVVVKKLSAVETLGGTSVICTDKTGTLTENRMTVKEVLLYTTDNETQQKILIASVLCNTAEIQNGGKEIGDPLEIALLNYAAQSMSPAMIRSGFPKVDEEPFSSETKLMFTVHQEQKGFTTYAKGAIESIINICCKTAISDLSSALKNMILNQAAALASSGYKVIGFAYSQNRDPSICKNDLTYIGMIGLIDPPRKDVAPAISECKNAGIKVVMITGDHPQTAVEIGRQLGMDVSNSFITGDQMKPYDTLSQVEKTRWLNASVFARVTPAQKLDLIKLYQENSFIVGMTGDGVNDAPALKKADIGIAMGLRGTQVAQDVSDMVIKDDSFTSIVKAIKQGRIIFDNIRKFVIFLLSCNLSELFTIAVTAILNLHFQLFPLQILFINLITDVLPALALGMTPGNSRIMTNPPRKSSEPIINADQWKAVIFYSVVISVASIGAVITSHYLLHETEGWNPFLCNNILFFTLIGSQLLHVLNMNASGTNFFTSEIIRNKYVWIAIGICIGIIVLLYEISPVTKALSIYKLSSFDWLLISFFSGTGLLINQLAKMLKIIKQ